MMYATCTYHSPHCHSVESPILFVQLSVSVTRAETLWLLHTENNFIRLTPQSWSKQNTWLHTQSTPLSIVHANLLHRFTRRAERMVTTKLCNARSYIHCIRTDTVLCSHRYTNSTYSLSETTTPQLEALYCFWIFVQITAVPHPQSFRWSYHHLETTNEAITALFITLRAFAVPYKAG